jgi:hypothetical protein
LCNKYHRHTTVSREAGFVLVVNITIAHQGAAEPVFIGLQSTLALHESRVISDNKDKTMLSSLVLMSLLTLGTILGPLAARSAVGDTVAIVNSGSTNRPGFRILIDRSGVAEFTEISRGRAAQTEKTKPIVLTISRALTDRLYADLEAAAPLASLPVPHCMKSVSFGSTLSIGFGAEHTPDLSCGDGGNPVVASLIRDCNQIAALFQGQ